MVRIILEFTVFILYLEPFLWEVKDDRFGDSDHRQDVVRRWAMAAIITFLAWTLGTLHIIERHNPLAIFGLVLSIHFFLFDYAIAYVLGHRDWFSYLSNNPKGSVVDRIKIWVKIGPWGRFSVKLIFLVGFLIWYFI